VGEEKPLIEDIAQVLKIEGTRAAAGPPLRLQNVRARSSIRMG
jgi:hypothetical protein